MMAMMRMKTRMSVVSGVLPVSVAVAAAEVEPAQAAPPCHSYAVVVGFFPHRLRADPGVGAGVGPGVLRKG